MSDEQPRGFLVELGDRPGGDAGIGHGTSAESVMQAGAGVGRSRRKHPWLVLEEAAKIGPQFRWTSTASSTGRVRLAAAVAFEVPFRHVGIGLSPAGAAAAVAAGGEQRDAEQIGKRCCICSAAGCVAICFSRGGQRRRRLSRPRGRRRRGRRVGAERGEDLGHERRHRERTRGRGVGGPAFGSRGRPAFIVPLGTPGLSMGRSSASTGSGRRIPRGRAVRRPGAGRARSVAGTARRATRRVREGGRSAEQAAMKTFEASRPGVAAVAVGVVRAATEDAMSTRGPGCSSAVRWVESVVAFISWVCTPRWTLAAC